MKINLAIWDRILRFTFGVLFVIWFILGGPWWSTFGIYLLATSGWGLCPIYSIFKIRSASADDHHPISPPEI